MDPAVQRVKVYKLNDEGTWDDRGTGHVNVMYYEHGVQLVVVAEGDNNRHLLTHFIGRDTAYQRQGEDTIITWSDNEMGTDVALSFQESKGCNRVWLQIQKVQDGSAAAAAAGAVVGLPQADLMNSPPAQGSPAGGGPGNGAFLRRRGGVIDEFDASPVSIDYGDMRHGPMHPAAAELPLPGMDNLTEIAKALSEGSMFQREALAGQMAAPGWLPRLLAAFRTAEDLEDAPTTAAAFAVVKGAILMNDTGLLDVMFSEEHVDDVIGALEYDPEVAAEERPKHRDHLRGPGAMLEVIPVTDPILRAKIMQAHRLGYVKDAVLPRALDDATFATLTSMQMFNQLEVLVALMADQSFFPQLFGRLQGATPGAKEWLDLVGFLQELVCLARHMQATQRNALLVRLIDLGLFPALASILASGDSSARLRAADVLLAVVAHDPTTLRAYLKAEGAGLFKQLVAAVLDPDMAGLQEQALEVLKVLLDPDTMDSSVEKDMFIDAFYEAHVGSLLTEVTAAGETSAAAGRPGPTASTLVLVLDLLCYCVSQHSYRIKYYILRNNVVEKVLRLLRRRERVVAAAALRFLRTCLAMRDEFYNRYLCKNSLLEPVLAAFLANGKRYNLLNSAILELLEFVRRENMKGLVAAVVTSPSWSRLEAEAGYVETFKLLQMRHDANLESQRAGADAVQGIAVHGSFFQNSQQQQQQQQQPGQHQPGQQQANPAQVLEQQRKREEAAAAASAAREAAAVQARRARGEHEEDADEENYFREDADDDEDDDDGGAGLPDGGVAMGVGPSPPIHGGGGGGGGGGAAGPSRPGRVVLESSSPLPGLVTGQLVDYGEDDDDEEDSEGDTLPLRVLPQAPPPQPSPPPPSGEGAGPKRAAGEQPPEAPPPEKKSRRGPEGGSSDGPQSHPLTD